jgi:hypothetical protein
MRPCAWLAVDILMPIGTTMYYTLSISVQS